MGNIFKFLPLIVAAVQTVEATIRDKGKAKKDKALELVGGFIEAAEGMAGRDLLNDPEVQAALSDAIDAVVAFENAVKRAKAARVVPEVPPTEAPAAE